MKHIETKTKNFIHAFFIIKKEEHYKNNHKIIEDFKRKPGLFYIAKKRDTTIEQVYNIVKTHDINVLNTNIIKLMELK